MSETENPQIASLGWVKDEINKSLEEARVSLEAHVENPDTEDLPDLKRCGELVKQVRGTLQMVQLQGALLLTEEMTHLIDALLTGSDKVTDSSQAYEALMRAILQLPDYFARVQSGQTDAAVILLPLINDLRAGYGEEAAVAESLFAPNFDGILPPPFENVEPFTDGDLSALITRGRHQVHLAMLGMFRGKDVEASLNKLIGLYEGFCVAAQLEVSKQLYWISAALCEAIRDKGLDAEALPLKPLLGQIDRQSKTIIDKGEDGLGAEPPNELVRMLLYYMATATSDGERTSAVKSAFRLGDYMPDEQQLEKLRDDLAGPNAEVLGTVVQGITQELDRARDMLDIYTRTGEQDNERLQQMVQALRSAAGTIAMIGDSELQTSINEYCDNLDALIDGSKTAEEAGMPALADFILQVDVRVQELKPENVGKDVISSAGPSLTGSTGMYDVRQAVVKEASANMGAVKDVIAAFVESPDSERGRLDSAEDLLQQIAGGLKVASLDRASDIVYALRSYIDNELIKGGKTPADQELESLAEAVSSADYYLEAVIGDLPNKEIAMDMAEAALDLLGYATGDVDQELQQMAQELEQEDSETSLVIDDESMQLGSLTEGLLDEFGETEGGDDSEAIEVDAEALAQEEEEPLEEVPLDEALSEVEEDSADVEEIEVAPPEESEEELSLRMSAMSDSVDWEELPSIEAVEETADAEELSVDAPVESEEEMLARVQADLAESAATLTNTGEMVVDDIQSEIEDVSLTSETEIIDEAAIEEAIAEEAIAEEAVAEEAPQDVLMSDSPLGDDLDEEIVDIFLEEAEEVLGELSEHFPIWRNDPSNSDSLTIVRRSFHTLKGSGRMVGANQIGEFAWAIENLLNKVIDNSIDASSEVMETIEKALEVLPVMVGQLQGGPAPGGNVGEIAAIADALAAGKPASEAGVEAETTSPAEKKIQKLAPTEQDLSSQPDILSESALSRPLLESDELRVVYTEETNQHLKGLRNFIAHCREDSDAAFFQEPQIVILHTLRGGAATVGAEGLKRIFDILEPLAILYNEHNEPVSDVLLEFMEQAIEQVQLFLDDVNGKGVDYVLDIELVDELGLLLQQKKVLLEATTSSIDILRIIPSDLEAGEQQVAEQASPESTLDEISTSLEDLHDLMSEDVELSDMHTGLTEELPLDQLVSETPVDQASVPLADQDTQVLDVSQLQGLHADQQAELEAVPLADQDTQVLDVSQLQGLRADQEAEQIPVSITDDETGGAVVSQVPELRAEQQPEVAAEVDPEILDIFIDEAAELLVSIEQTLDDWQNNQADQELMISIQRDIHTLKGGARMVNQSAIADIGHAMETLLTAIVDGQVQVTDSIFPTLHEARDVLQDLYEDIKQGIYNAPTNTELVARLESLKSGQATEAVATQPVPEPVPEPVPQVDPPQVQEPVAPPAAAEFEDEASASFELVEIFMEEAGELLQSIDQTLDEWQNDEDNKELIIRLQRDIHTLKGGARMVNLSGIGNLGHDFETLLTAVVDGHVEVTRPLFDGMHEVKDELQTMFDRVREGEGDSPVPESMQKLLYSLRHAGEQPPAGAGSEEMTPSHMLPAYDEDSRSVTLAGVDALDVTPSDALAAFEDESGSVMLKQGYPSEATPSDALAALQEDSSKLTKLVETVEKAESPQPAKKDQRAKPRVEHETVRVRSDLIDGLVNLAGETNIFRSRLEQQSSSFRFSLSELDQTVLRLQEQLKKLDMETEAQILFRHEKDLDNPDNENFDPLEMDRYSTLQQLSRSLVESVGDLNSLQDMLGGLTRDSELLLLQQGRVNSELQDRLMQARVVPFAATMASRLRRITRQTCQQLGKQAELRIQGANEEMDRHVLDRMVAPLEHMLRNSIAHGIESPEVRKQRGKPETGTITVSVSREGGEIVIQVADDGGGLDTSAIRKKAEAKELIVENAAMSDDEINQLVLTPGFSTADAVSQIAGRGVGMDVVNNEIRQLNGSLHIESVYERGAAMTVRLPFTLSITQALLVRASNELYAIPLTSIEGVSRIAREEAEQLMGDKEVQYTYGGDKYQISSLGGLLGRPTVAESEESRPAVILVRAGGHRVGFYIDELLGHFEIVVKSLGAQVSSINGMAGGTILGDGRVALILDIPALVRMVGAEHGMTETRQTQVIETPESVKLTVMVVDDSITVRRVTTRLLERHEMEVVTAKDGVDAIAKLEETIPDVMLLDVEMPRMDGYELATHVRNDERYKNVPIVMITSRTGAKHRERAEAIGVDRYLGKPYQEVDLLENINQVLDERRAH